MSAQLLGDVRFRTVDAPLGVADLARFDPAALVAGGVETVVVAEPVSLADDEFCVRFVRLLRESISVLLRIQWSLDGPVPVDPVTLYHLQPPVTQAGDGEKAWQHGYGFGLCFYRIGPGFLLLKDTRDLSAGARYRLDDERAVTSFPALEDAVFLPDAPPDVRELSALLEAERLVVRRGDWATLLPFRMRRWPVPFDAI